MQRRSLTPWVTLGFALVLAAPAAVGDWMAFGSLEPDTTFDRQGSFMWRDANTESVENVYLSVVPTMGRYQGSVGVWADPNVGAAGSRIYPAGNMQFDAIFGAWVDCNLDGYVGMAETALIEYPLELMPADSPCATMPMHAQQGWVSEVRWISNDHLGRAKGGNGQNRDGRVIEDNNATIWGDFGVPGNTMGREVCPRGFPRGSTETTGGLLNWADCFTAHRGWSAADPALGVLGMPFSEEGEFNEDGHPLNVETLGADDRNESVVLVYDCSAEREKFNTGAPGVRSPRQEITPPVGADKLYAPWVNVTDDNGDLNASVGATSYTNGQSSDSYFLRNYAPTTPRAVMAPSANPGGSVAGTYAHLVWSPTSTGDCDQTDASLYGQLESNQIAESAKGKNRVTVQFVYYEEQRNGAAARGPPWYGTQVYPLTRTLNTNGGGTHWYAASSTPSELGPAGPTPPQLFRTSDLQPEGAVYWTFYANLSAEGFGAGARTPGGVGIYGSEWCSISTDPAQNGGFVCDADAWYRAPDGTYVGGQSVGGFEYAPKPGSEYQLRDVDCFDGTIHRDVPAQASLVLASSEGPCPRMG